MHRVLQPHPAHGLCLQDVLQAQLEVYSGQEKLEAPGPLRRSISADPHKHCLPPVAGIDSLRLGPLNTPNPLPQAVSALIFSGINLWLSLQNLPW